MTRSAVQIVDFCQNFGKLKETFEDKADYLLAAALKSTEGEKDSLALAADILM